MGILIFGIAALAGLYVLASGDGTRAPLTAQQQLNIVAHYLKRWHAVPPVAIDSTGHVMIKAGPTEADMNAAAEGLGATLKIEGLKRSDFGDVYVKVNDGTRVRNLPIW